MGIFFKSFWRELGRNTGKRVSNAVYGDKWSTPYRARVSKGDEASKGKSKRKKSSSADNDDAVATRKSSPYYGNSVKINYAPYDPAVMQRIMDMFETYSAENISLRREHNRNYEVRRREADMKVMAVTKLAIPSSEHGLIDMMSKLLTLADGLHDYGFDKKVKEACLRKYRECYSFLEYEHPESKYVWHYYFVNAKHTLASVKGLVNTLLGLTAFFVFYWAIGGRRPSDINITIILLSVTFGIPILCLIWQCLRLWYFKRKKNN